MGVMYLPVENEKHEEASVFYMTEDAAYKLVGKLSDTSISQYEKAKLINSYSCELNYGVGRKGLARMMACIRYGFPPIETKFPKKKKRGTARRMRKWL